MNDTNIMIVEDEAIVAKDIQHSLEAMGYSVCARCKSGEAALLEAETCQPHLVLMDIVLDGEMDGTEAAKLLRERFGLPVIYLTAYTDDATLLRAREAEPYAYLPKPFDERELRVSIEMALYKYTAEAELREREAWFATTLSCIGDGVIATDEQNHVTYMNPIAELLTGWCVDDARNEEFENVFHIVWEETNTTAENPVRKCLEKDYVYETLKPTRLRSRNGMERPIDFSAAPIKDHRGSVTGAVLAFRDITGRKRAEEALRESEEQLRQSQKMDAVGRLAGGIAHDFNNMLTAILGYGRLALDELDDPKAMRDDVKQVIQTGERAAELTKQLLAFSRSEALPVRPLDLNNAMEEISELLKRTLTESIELDIVASPDPLGVKAELSQLQQMIMNLAINARDAMPQGGKLTICTSTIQIDEDECRRHVVEHPGEFVVLSVADTGCGMSKEVREHAFEPFYTTKEQGKGTGLGLSTVYGMAKRFDGFIDLRSEPHAGTEFNIYFPRVEVPAKPKRISAHMPLPRGAETILVVEDEHMIIDLATRVLRSLGYTVMMARDGLEAQAASREHVGRIDIMVTDLVMPRMGGYQLAESLSKERPEMKVLFTSGYTDDTISRHSTLDQDAPFLPKPFSPRALAQMVRSVLDGDEIEKKAKPASARSRERK